MTPDQKTILTAAARDLRAILALGKPGRLSRYRQVRDWIDAQIGHVRCQPALWLGRKMGPAPWKKFARNCIALERDGYIVRIGWEGGIKTHLMLTNKATSLLAQIEGSEAAAHEIAEREKITLPVASSNALI